MVTNLSVLIVALGILIPFHAEEQDDYFWKRFRYRELWRVADSLNLRVPEDGLVLRGCDTLFQAAEGDVYDFFIMDDSTLVARYWPKFMRHRSYYAVFDFVVLINLRDKTKLFCIRQPDHRVDSIDWRAGRAWIYSFDERRSVAALLSDSCRFRP